MRSREEGEGYRGPASFVKLHNVPVMPTYRMLRGRLMLQRFIPLEMSWGIGTPSHVKESSEPEPRKFLFYFLQQSFFRDTAHIKVITIWSKLRKICYLTVFYKSNIGAGSYAVFSSNGITVLGTSKNTDHSLECEPNLSIYSNQTEFYESKNGSWPYLLVVLQQWSQF